MFSIKWYNEEHSFFPLYCDKKSGSCAASIKQFYLHCLVITVPTILIPILISKLFQFLYIYTVCNRAKWHEIFMDHVLQLINSTENIKGLKYDQLMLRMSLDLDYDIDFKHNTNIWSLVKAVTIIIKDTACSFYVSISRDGLVTFPRCSGYLLLDSFLGLVYWLIIMVFFCYFTWQRIFKLSQVMC